MRVKIIISLFALLLASKLMFSQEPSFQALMDSCSFYQEKQDYQTALQWADKAEVQAKKKFGERDTNYIASLSKIYECYYYMGNTGKSIEYCEKVKQLIKEVRGGESAEYAEIVGDFGYLYNEIGRYAEAESLYKEALEMKRRIFKSDNPALAISINNIAGFYFDIGEYNKAESLFKEALEMRRRIFKEDHPELATSINNMASFYSGIGDYKQAEPLYKEALEMRRRIFKGDHPDLASSINSMGSLFNSIGDYKKAEPLLKEALEMSRRIFKGDHPDLASSINYIAIFYDIQADYKQAESLYKEALEMRRRIFKDDHPDLAISIGNLAAFYNDIGNYKKAEPLYKEALEMIRHIFKGDHPDLATSIIHIAIFYDTRGDYTQAEPLYIEALKMRRRLFKGDHPDLAGSINNIAQFYLSQGRYSEAEPLYKEALEMYKRLYKTDQPDLATSINNNAKFYLSQGRYSEAEPLYKEALEMYKRLFKTDHPNLAGTIDNIASFYDEMGDFKKAEPLYKEALEMYRRLFKSDHPELALSINNMAGFYNAIGNFKQAEPLYKEALEMRRRLFKENHPDLAKSINDFAMFFNVQGRLAEAEQLYLELMTVCLNLMNNYFPSLSEKEKEQYYNTLSKFYFQFNNFVVFTYNKSPKLLETMFDNQLLTKGMLLSASNKVRSRILSSSDTNLIQLFYSWKDRKEYISKLYHLSKAQLEKKNINLDSIIKSANEQEKELTKRSDVFRHEYDKQKLTWKDVQNNLGKDEAAIEIVRLNLIEKNRITDTVYYATLIVKKNLKKPELVLLKNGKELENEYLSNYYKSIQNQINDNSSYNQFWKPIAAKLKGIKKVFVSPDGVYNQINLATFKNPKSGKYLLDEKEIVLLSSSRDLVEHKIDSRFRVNDTNMVVELFGDPKFNLDSAQHLKLASNFSAANKADMERGVMESLLTRGGIEQLPGTRKEVEDIYTMFKNKNWDVRKHLGEDALEEAVKAINNPRILHIATHGLFLQDIEHINKDERTFGMEKQRFVENPLLRSMLLFAGAENTITKNSLSNSLSKTDDGLLTAYEAMNLNLDNTELVVLSACETGLGTIKNGEGVYGLQRAFIEAGAKTIIMSLWKINDETTQELMTTFYTKWLSGKTKRQSFKEAQLELKKRHPEPYYWGAFVMVGE